MRVEYRYFEEHWDYLLQQIHNLSAGPDRETISRFDYTYNPDRTIATWGILQGGEQSTWTLGYDPVQQLTDAVRRDPDGRVLEEEHYGYDRAANRISVVTGTTTVAVRNYEVNNLNQLVEERGFGLTRFAGTLDRPATVTVAGEPARVWSINGGAPYRFERWVDLAEGAQNVVVEATNADGEATTQTHRIDATSTTRTLKYD